MDTGARKQTQTPVNLANGGTPSHRIHIATRTPPCIQMAHCKTRTTFAGTRMFTNLAAPGVTRRTRLQDGSIVRFRCAVSKLVFNSNLFSQEKRNMRMDNSTLPQIVSKELCLLYFVYSAFLSVYVMLCLPFFQLVLKYREAKFHVV